MTFKILIMTVVMLFLSSVPTFAESTLNFPKGYEVQTRVICEDGKKFLMTVAYDLRRGRSSISVSTLQIMKRARTSAAAIPETCK